MQTLNVNGQIIELNQPIIMGILNITDDSFYDGGNFLDLDKALEQVDKMVSEGADIIDIGAFSSRPGAVEVSNSHQIAALSPIIEAVQNQYPTMPISLDVCQSEVVRELSKVTSFIVNDISGFSQDEGLIGCVSELNLPYVLMHMRGTPADMQSKTNYTDVTSEVLDYMAKKIHLLKSAGIQDLIIDPGFGFAKTAEQNFELLAKLNVFNIFELPVMVGMSRKSMIYKTLETTAQEALNGTTALHMAAMMNGAKILRVHDVLEAKETRTLWQHLQSPS